ncbi:MAG TPA: TerC family protein [Victivallales bacterium]|nr:TerC family protein [Victivallales bacterium]
MADSIILLLILIGLELVLGIDNILVISIFVGKLPAENRNKARFTGLACALIARIIMIYVIVSLTRIDSTVIFDFSVKDLILLAGGMFLLWKAVNEIHLTVELKEDGDNEPSIKIGKTFAYIIIQIIMLDIVFSIDSVVTAIGLTNHLWVIISAVLISFIAILGFSIPIGNFILKHPSIKILALSFLVTIGITIFMEGMHKDVPKEYIYLPMGFALFVEMLQMRYTHNKRKNRIKLKREAKKKIT